MSDTPLEGKSLRLLQLYDMFQSGQIVKKANAAAEFGVTERSIQRDIEDLRCYLAGHAPMHTIVYDTKVRGYRLTDKSESLFTNSETLAVCKILMESRSMVKDEMLPIIEKLVTNCVPERDKKIVKDLINNEKFHYIEPHHQQRILPGLWEIGQAIQNQQVMEITYERMKEPKIVIRRIQPVGIMFSEYYFYLTAYIQNVDKDASFENKEDPYPTIYRIDRIRDFKVLNEHFRIPYTERFEEGEFRKRVQFMYGGKLERIKFRYKGMSLEAALDRLPTARVLSEDEEGWVISAEVFGKGIDMWLRSQGEYVERVE